MTQYAHVAEQIKESLIEEYLRKNPGVSRSEVTTMISNGNIVVGSIKDVLQKVTERVPHQQVLSGPSEALLKKLAEGSDIRYAKSLQSIDTSKSYIQWLAGYRFAGFSKKEQQENLQFLDQQTTTSGLKAVDFYEVRLKLVKAMKEALKPTRSLIQTMMLEYFDALREQLKSQRVIYKREVDLGGRFCSCSTAVIHDNFMLIRSGKNPAAMRAIEKAVQILKENAVPLPQITKDSDVKLLTNSIGALEEKLEGRRMELEELNNLTAFLNEIITGLKNQSAELFAEKRESKYRTKREG